MKVSKEQSARNRSRILEAAGRLFRQRGFDGIGVADLMKEAGLTHGGFYGHFASKDDLVAQACAQGLGASVAKWQALVAAAPAAPLDAIAASYLSRKHRDDPGEGCVCPTLAAEAARHSESVRRNFTDGLRGLVAVLEEVVPGGAKGTRREEALATMAGLVGAMVLARAVDDPAFSDEILAAAEASVGRE